MAWCHWRIRRRSNPCDGTHSRRKLRLGLPYLCRFIFVACPLSRISLIFPGETPGPDSGVLRDNDPGLPRFADCLGRFTLQAMKLSFEDGALALPVDANPGARLINS